MTEELMLVIDTETLGDVNNPKTVRVYDFGYVVRDRAGKVYEAGSFVVADTFYCMSHDMQSAYYAEKLPQYHLGTAYLGAWHPISFLDLKNEMTALIREYGIKRVFAYNCTFDKKALNTTTRALSHGFSSYFMPYGIEWCDLWKPACELIMNNKKYFQFAIDNGFVSAKGNVKTSAESCYAFLTRNGGYMEHHTGLEDVLIESDILTALFNKRKKLDFTPSSCAWRIPQKKFKKFVKEMKAEQPQEPRRTPLTRGFSFQVHECLTVVTGAQKVCQG